MYLRNEFQHFRMPYMILGVALFCVLTIVTRLLILDREAGIKNVDAMNNMITKLEGQIRFLEASMSTKELRWKGMTELSEFYANEMRRVITLNDKCKEKMDGAQAEVAKIYQFFGEDWHAVHSKYTACLNSKENATKQHEKMKRELEKQLEYYKSLSSLGISVDKNCNSQITWSRDKTLEEVYKVLGSDALIAIYKAGGDMGSYLPQIKTLAERKDSKSSIRMETPRAEVDKDRNHPKTSSLSLAIEKHDMQPLVQKD